MARRRAGPTRPPRAYFVPPAGRLNVRPTEFQLQHGRTIEFVAWSAAGRATRRGIAQIDVYRRLRDVPITKTGAVSGR